MNDTNPDKKPDEKPVKGDGPEGQKGLTMNQVLQHPMVLKMHTEITQLRKLVEGLPEAIGRAMTAAQEARRVPGIDIANPELLTGKPFSKEELVVQNLQAELDKAREDIGYIPPSPPKPKK